MKKRLTTRLILAVLLSSSLLCFGRDADDATQASVDALLLQSDLKAANALASEALKKDSKNLSALFVKMEAARLTLDENAEIRHALRICEIDPDDARAQVGAGRLRELAQNTEGFRGSIAGIKRAIANGGAAADTLKLALVAAASDGTPEFDLLQQSREYGLLTDWALQGPFGANSAQAFERAWPPEKSGNWRKLREALRDRYQFADGAVALPKEAAKAGVYYAQGEFELPATGTWRIRVQTLGTVQVFVDGKSVLRKDARSENLPEVSWQNVHLQEGTHKTLVKFSADATPFRIAVLPPSAGPKKRRAPQAIHAGPESEYVTATLHFLEGDFDSVITSSVERSEKFQGAAMQILLGDAWLQVEEYPPEALAAYTKALERCNECTRSSLQLSSIHLRKINLEGLSDTIEAVMEASSRSVAAVELAAHVATALHQEHARSLVEEATRRHPSVTNFRNAAAAAWARGDNVQANTFAQKLTSSSQGAMALSELRREQGRHHEAAHVLQAWAEAEPLNRDMWNEYARESLMAEDYEEARVAAEHLLSISPEVAQYLQLLRLAAGRMQFADAPVSSWYTVYRRRAEPLLIRNPQTAAGVVQLLDDRAWRVEADGAIDEYVHTLTRLGNRAAVISNAEITVPEGAQVLSLRTIEPDGEIAEPELIPEKSSISMPGLTPGAAVEVEYTLRHEPKLMPRPMQFVFGSFGSSVEHSRLVVLVDDAIEVKFAEGAGAPQRAQQSWQGMSIFTWQRDGIAPLQREIAMLNDAAYQPSLTMTLPAFDAKRTEMVAQLVEAKSRTGVRSKLLAARLSAGDASQTAKNIYEYVKDFVVQDDEFETADRAEDALRQHRGNRTFVFHALAKAAGLESAIVLAADYAKPDEFVQPLVKLVGPGLDQVVDAQADELPFGTLAPTTSRQAAIEISSKGETRKISLPPLTDDERSIARGDIQIREDGSLDARIEIALGLTRGNELRRNLRTMTAAARQHFLEDVGTRILPSVVSVSGEIRNEGSQLPITIVVRCRTNSLLGESTRVRQTRNIQQLVPGLGLRNMYAIASARRYPVNIDSVLFESTRFRVAVVPGMGLRIEGGEVNLTSNFGTYVSHARQVGAGVYEYTREFRVPMQLVLPNKYGAFKNFADQIDAAERTQLELTVVASKS